MGIAKILLESLLFLILVIKKRVFKNNPKKDNALKKNKKAKKHETYPLCGKLEGKHFSRQEARCMMHLLRGSSIKRIAQRLELSPRTVEFYLNNMKKKLDCRTKFELIDAVLEAGFEKMPSLY